MNAKTKKVLIISPYFIPYNTPDMQRVRMSLPYFEEMGWDAEVVTVHPKYTELIPELQLAESIPQHIPIHYVNALPKDKTIKFGLGSLALRSLRYYHKKVSQLLSTREYDLIYFSTTQYPVCVLGAIWRRKFGIPYIIDVQDPWHTDYYKSKPKAERPPKYWFSYHLNKYLEPMAMKNCEGLISVSQEYLDDLTERYPKLSKIPQAVVTFGYSEIDIEYSKKVQGKILKTPGKNQLVYTGVLGPMMHKSLDILFKALQDIQDFQQNFQLSFIGTSYAPDKKAKKTAWPIIQQYHLEKNTIESTERMGVMETLSTLNTADGLILVGTDDPGYTASKLYPYLQARKPILAILHSKSSAYNTLKALSDAIVIRLDGDLKEAIKLISVYLKRVKDKTPVSLNQELFSTFSAKSLTGKQVAIFNEVITAQYMI